MKTKEIHQSTYRSPDVFQDEFSETLITCGSSEIKPPSSGRIVVISTYCNTLCIHLWGGGRRVTRSV